MKEIEFDRLIRKIKGKRVPFSVVFEMTRRCNLSCVHCYLPGRASAEKELDRKRIEALLRELAEAGCLKLTMTGGEPTLRKDFLHLFSFAQERGFAVTLFTNGTLLSPELLRALAARPPLSAECSLYGASGRVHDAITRCPGSFEASTRAIEWLIGNGVRVVIKMVVLSLNFHEVEEVRDLCRVWGTPFQPTFRVFSSLDPGRSPEKLRLKPGELRTLLKSDESFTKMFGHAPEGEDWICNAGREACCISAEGKVFPCVALRWDAGDVTKESFNTIWDRSPVLETIRSFRDQDFRKCFRCPSKRACRFCPGMGFMDHGDMLRPSAEMCRITRAAGAGGKGAGRN